MAVLRGGSERFGKVRSSSMCPYGLFGRSIRFRHSRPESTLRSQWVSDVSLQLPNIRRDILLYGRIQALVYSG